MKRKLVRVPWSKNVVEMFFFFKKRSPARITSSLASLQGHHQLSSPDLDLRQRRVMWEIRWRWVGGEV
jgi:hypothetical protein